MGLRGSSLFDSKAMGVAWLGNVPSRNNSFCPARMCLYTAARGKQEGSLTHGPFQLAFANDTYLHQPLVVLL